MVMNVSERQKSCDSIFFQEGVARFILVSHGLYHRLLPVLISFEGV